MFGLFSSKFLVRVPLPPARISLSRLRAQASSHCAPNVGPFPRHEGDHFQPHYRMPFALVSGRKDGPFSIDLAASQCLLILWLSAALPASYANVESCGIQNGNASSNHTSSATQSELQRKCVRSALKDENNARISRLFTNIPDCRERTARQRGGDCHRFSPEGTCTVRFQSWH